MIGIDMIKYPKTPRFSSIANSNVFSEWKSYNVFVEEKIDGANAAISFEDDNLVLQSRGHVLIGGSRERLFERLHPWAYERLDGLREALGTRYMAFGEWIYAKNRIFYDWLPDFFIEFDIWDKENGYFLSTHRRHELLQNSPLISVCYLWEGKFGQAPNFTSFIGRSRYKTDRWREKYDKMMKEGLDKHYKDDETDDSRKMEGVYLKIEDEDKVVGRAKILREGFEKIRTDDKKWGRRPLFPNLLSSSTAF